MSMRGIIRACSIVITLLVIGVSLSPPIVMAADQNIAVSATPPSNPTVDSVSPASAKQNDIVGFIIGGSQLAGASSVSFGAGITVLDFTVDTDIQISGNLLVAYDAALGLRDVTVTNPLGSGSKSDAFTVLDGHIAGYDEAVAHNETLNWQTETSTVLVVVGSGTISSALYLQNPVPTAIPAESIKYYDVRCLNATGLTSLTVRLYYSAYDISDLTNPVPYFWNGSSWIACSNYTRHADYVEVYIDGTTTPTLNQLQGTHFGLGGVRPVPTIAELLVQTTIPIIFVAILVVFVIAVGMTQGLLAGAIAGALAILIGIPILSILVDMV